MKLSKKILLIALGTVFHGVVMTMETSINDTQQQALNSIKQAKILAHLRFDNNPAPALEVVKWLAYNRTTIIDVQQWEAFVDDFVRKMARCRSFSSIANEKLKVLMDIVKGITYGLKPGEDCSQLLVDRAQEEMLKLEFTFKDTLFEMREIPEEYRVTSGPLPEITNDKK